MSEYRRIYVPGSTYFFTVVTHRRRPLFTQDAARRFLRNSFREVRSRRPFRLDAICLLPDHLHCLWTLPPNDADFSRRWQEIKGGFSKDMIRRGGISRRARPSLARKGEVEVWQRRFWDHCIRDEGDFRRHFDYIHYNPVKHGLVRRPLDWPWSSFARYVGLGCYAPEWGCLEAESIENLEVGE